MKVVGCVAEFNPFHNGHKYFIERVKEKTGATHTVAVMSEYFTQRGEPTLISSAARTEAALSSGVDLVLSLPVDFALSSAEKFAFGSVYVLDALGVVDFLAFGSECGANADIKRICEAVMSDDFTAEFKRISRHEMPFAALREEAVKRLLTCSDFDTERITALMRNPNDILAIEYNKALIKLKSKIIPISVKRKKCGHDTDTVADGIASASLVRKRFASSVDFNGLVPKTTYEIIQLEAEFGRILAVDYGARILSVLRRVGKSAFEGVDDVREGIENRIFEAVGKAATLDELVHMVKTKRYALSRIRRIVMLTYIGVISQEKPAAIRILGFNKKGAEILHSAKKNSKLSIITKPADYSADDAEIVVMMRNEAKAADMYGVLCKSIIPMGNEFKKFPVKFVKND